MAAAARLAAGDLERGPPPARARAGAELRERAGRCVGAARCAAEAASAPPGTPCSKRAEAAGEEAEAATREALEEEAKPGVKRSAKDITDEAKRAGRRRRTEILDLGLELCATWFRDLAAVASGARRSSSTATASTSCSSRPRGSIPPAPAAPPSWSRTPAAASTSTSPRS